MIVTRLYRKTGNNLEYCFNIGSSAKLNDKELNRLRLLLADGLLANTVLDAPNFTGKLIVEMGPRLNFETAWSTNMVSICRAIGLDKVSRLERSRRYLVPEQEDLTAFTAANHDRMTECVYPEPLKTFETGIEPEGVYDVDLITKGPDALS